MPINVNTEGLQGAYHWLHSKTGNLDSILTENLKEPAQLWKKLISKTLSFSKSDCSRVAPKTVNIFLRFLGSSRIISVLSEFQKY